MQSRRTQRVEILLCSPSHHRRPSSTSIPHKSAFTTSSVRPQEVSHLQQWLSQQQSQHTQNVLDTQTCLSLLHTCGKWKLLSEGRCIHAILKTQKHISAHISIANCLLNMYGKCHSLEDAKLAFDEILNKDVVSWTSMIGIYVKSGHSEDAFHVFEQMLRQLEHSVTCDPNDVTFITLLNACNGRVSDCNRVYSLIVIYRYESDVSVANAVVTTYAKCGSISDAHSVFENMKDRNVVSWTTMIKAFSADLNRERSYETLNRMHIEGVTLNTITYITLIHACSAPEALLEGMRIHVVIAEMDGFSDIVLGGALVNMYGKCGRIDDACKVFNVLPHRNVIIWNSMIKILCIHDHPYRRESFKYFAKMQLEGVKPDIISFIIILSLCTNPADLYDGMLIHAWCVEIGLESSEEVACALIDMYGKCRNIVDAYMVHLNGLQKQKYNVLSWSCLIAVYVNAGRMHEALRLFYQMQLEGLQPNGVTFSSLLSGFRLNGSNSNLMVSESHGKITHVWANEIQVSSNDIVGSSLISMYGKFGNLKEAQKVFDEVLERSVVTWNALIGAYGQNGYAKRCLETFDELMLSHDHHMAKPNNISFSCVLSTCADMCLLGYGKKIHVYIIECSMETDVMISSALINLYGKCWRLEEAQWMFDTLHERNLVTWNSIISAHSLYGNAKQVTEIFEQMKIEGVKPNESTMVSILEACSVSKSLKEGEVIHASIIQMGYEKFPIVGNALINMYANCGSLRAAQTTFDVMEERNLVSWNTMIGIKANNGMQTSEIFQLFKQMQQDHIDFDKISLVQGLNVCARMSLLSESQILYSCAIDKGIPIDLELGNVLMSVYANTGNIEDARIVFNYNIPHHDVISWTTMIVAYTQHAYAREAIELFQLMYCREGIEPTQISFVSILSACSHAGLVDIGCGFFSSMNAFGIVPTSAHYNCLLDLLGRSGQLDRAEDLFVMIPTQPERVLWITMLSACKTHEDFERGDRVAKNIMSQLEDYIVGDCKISSCMDVDIILPDQVVNGGIVNEIELRRVDMRHCIKERLVEKHMDPMLKDVEMDEIYVELKTLSNTRANDADLGPLYYAKNASQLSAECDWLENHRKRDELQQLVSLLR